MYLPKTLSYYKQCNPLDLSSRSLWAFVRDGGSQPLSRRIFDAYGKTTPYPLNSLCDNAFESGGTWIQQRSPTFFQLSRLDIDQGYYSAVTIVPIEPILQHESSFRNEICTHDESKSKALNGARMSSIGAGIRSMIARRMALTPCPVLADTFIISAGSMLKVASIWAATCSG